MSLLRTAAWFGAGFAAAHVLESAWHRFIAHGKRADPTRTMHLEHHRRACEHVDVPSELRDQSGRAAIALAGVNVALAPLLGLRRTVPLTIGVAAGLVAVNFYHAEMHRRAPHGRYEEWMWRFHWHHHAANARVNFGLTNPLLDFVLGTAIAPEQVVLHERIAPEWLTAAAGSCAGLQIATPRST